MHLLTHFRHIHRLQQTTTKNNVIRVISLLISQMPLKYQYSYSAQTATRSTLHQLLCISEAQLLFLQATTFETQDVLPNA